MKTLNENQKDILNVVLPVALFWLVMTYFLSTTPNYIKEDKIIGFEKLFWDPIIELSL